MEGGYDKAREVRGKGGEKGIIGLWGGSVWNGWRGLWGRGKLWLEPGFVFKDLWGVLVAGCGVCSWSWGRERRGPYCEVEL